jgi:anti-sigma B factor antagonist
MEVYGLRCDVERPAERVVNVTCHGRLVAGTTDTIKETIKPLIKEGGEITVDLGDVEFVDSMGLGALVGLKISAIGAGYCTLEFKNLSKRVQELMHMTHLTDLFKS